MPASLFVPGCYLLLINLVAAIVTLRDKRRAKAHKWRTRESTLLWLGALGGAPAMWLTMLGIHHKTTRKKFMVGLPVMAVFQLALCGMLLLFAKNNLL